MTNSIEKILRNHYVDGGFFHTHVSLIQPKGKYSFNRQGLEEFWDVYNNLICEEKEIIVGVAEKPQGYLPVLADIDIKIREIDGNDLGDQIYSDNHVMSVIEIYQSVLKSIVEECTDEHLMCVLLEKPMYRITKNNITYSKNGFHLHFPNLFISKVDQEVHLIPRVQEIIKEHKVFEDLGFEDSGELVDKACCRVPWLLYGSRKSEEMLPYKITKIFNSECVELTLEKAFQAYHLYDVREQLIDIKDNVELYIPRILSILPYNRPTKELKHGLVSPLKEKIKQKDQKKCIKVSVTEALKISGKLLPMLSIYRSQDRNEWITIGWLLYNIGDGCQEALDQWLDFSAKDEEQYDEESCIYEWERMNKKDLTLGSLRYFASVDNPEMYTEFKKEQAAHHIQESINGSHNDIAQLLFTEYGHEFVCASVTNRVWFQYINHKWEQIEEGIFLRKKISSEIVNKYHELGKKIYEQKANIEDKSEALGFENRFKLVNRLIQNLKSAPYKSNIMKEAAEVFYDKRFREKLDTNPHIIAFNNGIYDLKENIFRCGRPEDFLSKALPIDYKVFSEDDQPVHDVHDFLEKVFPDKTVREYFKDQSSDVFEGGNSRKIVLFWTGEGDNAKSVTQNIFEKMLGNLAIKFNTTVVTGKKPSTGSAYPDLARAGGGVRWAVLEEPDGDEMVNVGVLKHLSGNDSFYARDLFEKGKDGREIVPMFKLTFIVNKLPKMKYSDKATWNRIRVIPFESTFCRPDDPAPETLEEQIRQKRFPMDPNFSKKIPNMLQAFAWVLLEHRKNITTRIEPQKVRAATALYRKQNDIYRQFIEECITEDESSALPIVELYSEFKLWFKEGFPGHSLPVKNDVREYFSRLWDEPIKGKWPGYRINGQQDNINDGSAIVITKDDLRNYEEDGRAAPPL